MTALLLVFGIFGSSEVAADIGLVQGATLALFYAFSANARNLILADASNSAAIRLLQTRLFLLLPLAGAAYFLSVGIGAAPPLLVVVLIVRRMSEWVGEIGLARHERMSQPKFPLQTLVAECVTFLLCLMLSLWVDLDLAFCAIPWALVPLLAIRRAQLSWRGGEGYISFRALLPHFGSTAIIGTSVYVFRISIVLLAGKVIAGDLFTAFAIGGIIPTVYGQALAPTLAHRYGASRSPRWLLLIPMTMLICSAGVVALAISGPAWLADLGRSRMFWLAVGLSIAGGALMSVAAALRTRLIQQADGGEVFGPDLLANVLIATCVPFVFYVLGPNSLSGLYALSGCLSLAFLWGAGHGRGINERYLFPALFGIGVLLVFPLFFQISGGVFRDPAFVFDTGGSISRLPIPVSVAALFGGIALLGNYQAATRTLTILFFSALLFVTTSLAAAQGNSTYEGAKLILLAQFLLPMFGLVLGQMYGAATREPIFEHAALWVLLLVIPAQLVATWLQGYTLMSPKVFAFSIYQHLQYFPMIIAALTTMACTGLWRQDGVTRYVLMMLLPLLAVHLTASMSFSALAGLLFGLAGFTIWHWRRRESRRSIAMLFAATLVGGGGYAALVQTGMLSNILNPTGPIEEMSWQTKLSPVADNKAVLAPAESKAVVSTTESKVVVAPTGVSGRLDYWRFYVNGVLESPRNFLLGHATPPDRSLYPSAHNYWLDGLYNFGAIAVLPLIILMVATLRLLWQRRTDVLANPILLGTAMAAIYLLLGENMLKVGMRQPYPGIITFFIWGLLLARLNSGAVAPAAKRRCAGAVA